MLKPFSYTLVIVDMQYGFTSSRADWLNNNILQEIKFARKNSQGIIVLEYERDICGRTYKELIDPIRNYPFKKIVEKLCCDGSEEIMELCREHSFLNKNWFKVCGVNTSECVNDTVISLYEATEAKSKIEVLKKCCNDYTDCRPKDFDPYEGITDYCKKVELVT